MRFQGRERFVLDVETPLRVPGEMRGRAGVLADGRTNDPGDGCVDDCVDDLADDLITPTGAASVHPPDFLPYRFSDMSDAFDREAFIDDFARSRWPTLAKHAWRMYGERGRGAVVYPVQEKAGNGSERAPLRYLTFTDTEAAHSGPFSMLHHFVETYDPETQVVLVVQFPDESTVFDVYENSPPPREAE